MPWSATITYGRDANPVWEERICAENVLHDYESNFYSDKNAHLPMADSRISERRGSADNAPSDRPRGGRISVRACPPDHSAGMRASSSVGSRNT